MSFAVLLMTINTTGKQQRSLVVVIGIERHVILVVWTTREPAKCHLTSDTMPVAVRDLDYGPGFGLFHVHFQLFAMFEGVKPVRFHESWIYPATLALVTHALPFVSCRTENPWAHSSFTRLGKSLKPYNVTSREELLDVVHAIVPSFDVQAISHFVTRDLPRDQTKRRPQPQKGQELAE